MGVRVKTASSPEEIRSLVEVRHRVFVEEDGYLPAHPDGVIADFYDALPTTVNLIAIVHGEVCGGLRMTIDSAAGMPSDGFYPFRTHLGDIAHSVSAPARLAKPSAEQATESTAGRDRGRPDIAHSISAPARLAKPSAEQATESTAGRDRGRPDIADIASCSMLCLRRGARLQGRLLAGMLRMAVYWAHQQGLQYLCAPMNPLVRRIVERIGFVAVGEQFVDDKGLPTLPMVLELAKMTEEYAHFVQRQDFGLWMDSFERAFFDEGEPIVTEGEAGEEAYLVVEGEAAALARGGGEVVQTFGRASVFGELALLTRKPRSATVVAQAPTDVMVLHRDAFERQIRTNPDLAMQMMRSIGARFHEAVVRS